MDWKTAAQEIIRGDEKVFDRAVDKLCGGDRAASYVALFPWLSQLLMPLFTEIAQSKVHIPAGPFGELIVMASDRACIAWSINRMDKWIWEVSKLRSADIPHDRLMMFVHALQNNELGMKFIGRQLWNDREKAVALLDPAFVLMLVKCAVVKSGAHIIEVLTALIQAHGIPSMNDSWLDSIRREGVYFHTGMSAALTNYLAATTDKYDKLLEQFRQKK